MRVKLFSRAIVFGAVVCAGPAISAQPVTVGWLERVTLGDDGLVVSAKLDTGADRSSLHAADIRWSKREDGDWVAFDVVAENGRSVRFERKVLRVARVRRHEGGVQRRPVVLLELCLGNVRRQTQVNLTDRGGFTQILLVGRSFLAEGFAVDSSRTYTVEPVCNRGSGR
jgi:hypothetical protein